jgi:hypothetical protein
VKKIDKEIKELYERSLGGGLSKKEEAAILEHLAALQNLKLKLQMFMVGGVISAVAELLSVELTPLVEASKEEDKKEENTSSKEATKEVRKDLEIKAGGEENPKIVAPISLFDFSSALAKPIPLTKPECDLLPESLKNLMNPVQERGIRENGEVQKSKVGEEKKTGNQKERVGHSTASKQPAKNTVGQKKMKNVQGCNSNWATDKNLTGSVSVNNCRFDFTVGFGNGPGNEPKQSSLNDA